MAEGKVGSKVGSGTKLNKRVCEVICDGLRRGHYIQTCCEAAGIKKQTYYNWKDKGKKGIEPYKSFYEKSQQALAEGEMRHLDLINQAAMDGNWACSAWILERRYPEKYGKRTNLNLGGSKEFKIEISAAPPKYELGEEEKKLLMEEGVYEDETVEDE